MGNLSGLGTFLVQLYREVSGRIVGLRWTDKLESLWFRHTYP